MASLKNKIIICSIFLLLNGIPQNIAMPSYQTLNSHNFYQYNVQGAIDKTVSLTIPKINFFHIINENENLKTGLKLERNLKSIVILGHSGIGKEALFNNLYLLDKNDYIMINKQGETLKYQIYDIKYIRKNVSTLINNQTNYLYLVTCDTINMQRQIVICAKLI